GALVGFLEAGAVAGLPRLELLDLSRWRRPACYFTRREWIAFVSALPHAVIHGSANNSSGGCFTSMPPPGGHHHHQPHQPHNHQLPHQPHHHHQLPHQQPLCVRLDWRVLPLRSVWSPPAQLPEWQGALWALGLLARRRPQIRIELEGPPLPLPGPATLRAFRGLIG
ncbi:hypothetical protein Agub_g5735, partial [Astrephomene gubernaculifera]